MRIAMLTNNYRSFMGGVPISVERQAELTASGFRSSALAVYEGTLYEQV